MHSPAHARAGLATSRSFPRGYYDVLRGQLEGTTSRSIIPELAVNYAPRHFRLGTGGPSRKYTCVAARPTVTALLSA